MKRCTDYIDEYSFDETELFRGEVGMDEEWDKIENTQEEIEALQKRIPK